MDMVNLLDHEFYDRSDSTPLNEMFAQRLDVLTKLGEIQIENGEIKNSAASTTAKSSKTKQGTSFSYISFFGDMSSYLTETYMLVILAVKEINEQNLRVREERLLSELHYKIQ